ncbi:exo-alpha-sialidase [uncultured Microbulbifer sp.]|uniref:sialidase family protein n=1 Tax=uncultured Microbulbifer sp. TaxID=348147 RepID=UPI0025DA25FC|nr:sialidase family protein [uncultured Microbulbifer sp.]
MKQWVLAAVMLCAGCGTTTEHNAQNAAVVGRSWINPDAGYPQSHASTLVQTDSGALLAAWFGGTHERHQDVAIYVARWADGTWQPALKVATGSDSAGNPMPTWNPVLFQSPGQPLTLFYKVGPNPREWWGMMMQSADDGATWSHPARLPDGMIGPVKNKPITTGMGAWLAPSSTEDNGQWRLHFEQSKDQGQNWTKTAEVDPGPGLDAIQPSILTYPDGRLQALARTKQGVMASTWSYDRGRNWTPLAAIDLPNPNSGTDAVTLASGLQLLVYNHSAHAPNTPGKGPRYPLNIALSRDGEHWYPALPLEAEPIKEGYGYPAVIQTDNGLVHISYTVGRKRIRHVVVDPSRLAIQLP